jgi:hypothetical protein
MPAGFAIMSIMLLIMLNILNIIICLKNFPAWLVNTDKIVWDSLLFIFEENHMPFCASFWVYFLHSK